jgi:phenylalanine-4-hydroxylase
MAFTHEEILKTIPCHLRQYVHRQNYENYTPQEHAVWRYVMRQLHDHLKTYSHPVYQEGLVKTGISLEHLPSIEEMNGCLDKLGWKAVAVDGFIPPAAFMEFQMLKILPIALDMRTFEHVLYTPAPDIVHESAGHAPFLADIDYGEYLQLYGEYGSKAMFTRQDQEIYDAIRHLSVIKEDLSTTREAISQAEEDLKTKSAANKIPSESALIARLFWWMAEYGLVGTVSDYKIFGAGLLSSMGESRSCLDDEKVKKIPLTVDCVDVAYDITETQPQLFITKSCKHMTQVLEELADTMCFRKGGAESVQMAIDCEIVATYEYDSGLQVSGQVAKLLKNAVGTEYYIGTTGPTQLCYQGKELPGHDKTYHAHGFGSPVGGLQNINKPLAELSIDELRERGGIEIDKVVQLDFLSGVKVKGKLVKVCREQQKNIIMAFEDCTVTDFNGDVLFQPDWGTYDMAIGNRIVSVYAGAADKEYYEEYPAESPLSHEVKPATPEEKQLYEGYQSIRDMRTNNRCDVDRLQSIYEYVCACFTDDWLIRLELLELLKLKNLSHDLQTILMQDLDSLKQQSSEYQLLISRGLALL